MLNNLIKRILELSIKQKDLANFIGYSSTYYSNIENGNKDISVDILIKLSYILNIHPLSILEIIPNILPLDDTSRFYIKKKYNFKDEEIKQLSNNNKTVYNTTK